LDPDGLILACATASEEKRARRAGRPASRVGLGGANGFPPGRLVSFGLAGALRDDLAPGDVLDVVRIVDPDGAELWSADAIGIPGARRSTIVAAKAVIDDPAERRRLAERSGADAVDLESGPLAQTGRLVGGVRVVSDTPARRLGTLSGAVRPDGRVRLAAVASAFAREPITATRAVAASLKALRSLERAAGGIE
jgi:hypothetical protein